MERTLPFNHEIVWIHSWIVKYLNLNLISKKQKLNLWFKKNIVSLHAAKYLFFNSQIFILKESNQKWDDQYKKKNCKYLKGEKYIKKISENIVCRF